VQVADHRRRTEIPAGQVERVLCGYVQARQPQPGLVLAALGDRVGEQVELGQRQIEPQPQECEPPLLFGRGRAGAGPAQPHDVAPDLPSERPPSGEQVTLDSRLRRRRESRGGQHRLLDGERLDPVQSREHGARLALKHPGGELCRGHGLSGS
jgi:hypothetical protein